MSPLDALSSPPVGRVGVGRLGPEPTLASAAAASSPITDALVERVQRRLLADPEPAGPETNEARVQAIVRDEAPLLDDLSAARTCALVVARIAGLGPLEPFLGDDLVTDVLVNGGGDVWVDRAGRLVRTGLTLDEATTLRLIERVLAPLGRHVDRANPIVDARLADGSRVHAIVAPLAIDGPCLTIRRFGARPVRLDDVATSGVAAMLRWAVVARANVIVSGGAGAGKTTLLNALAGAIPPGERIVTIEDAAELRLPGDHVVRLESRPASAEGQGEVRIRDLVRASLRMRPDRIVVGEVRSGEALDMLQAMNTGHEGSLSTCHANGTLDALRRLETMVLMGDVDLPHAVVRDYVTSAIDLVVHIKRGGDGQRRVVAVDEVGPLDGDGRIDMRSLATAAGLRALPQCPARSAGAGASRPGLDRTMTARAVRRRAVRAGRPPSHHLALDRGGREIGPRAHGVAGPTVAGSWPSPGSGVSADRDAPGPRLAGLAGPGRPGRGRARRAARGHGAFVARRLVAGGRARRGAPGSAGRPVGR